MLTVALPERGPQIEGGKPRYQIGDLVRVNCSSGPSKPAAQLQWYINGIMANHSNVRGPRIRVVDREGLEETILGLEFRVDRRHFQKGDLKLKCLASIGTVYWNSNEESVEGERPQRPPALEVKDTKPHTSRADRVLVSSSAARGPAMASLLILLCSILAVR
ncbi:unnamed protein product [Nezara viridula]|uniref:CD80-like immunoglobulin C2-set domain-containing protein n=1 Tax=Nezara viridula TaxID=85310 RepID=A0A9P0MWG4_NEZVI|nr:unnamed protein product [Nezara viridula]